MNCLKKIAEKVPPLEILEKQTGFKKEHSLAIVCLLFVILVLMTPFGPLITSVVGVVIPLQETLTILKQANPKKEEMKHMLVFWIVFGVIATFDYNSRYILRFVPFWNTVKMGFLLWAGPLKFNAGSVIYECVFLRVPEEWYTGCRGIEMAARRATDAVKEAVGSRTGDDTDESDRKVD